jgi:HAD superfamily hydrolase (TIGR01662 family)
MCPFWIDMTNQIEAILFDMGGTLRTTSKRTREEKQQIIQRMMELIDYKSSTEEFTHLLLKRAKAYKHWSEQTHIELNESDLWTKWMLHDFSAAQISRLAMQLNQLYRDVTGLRVAFPESREVVLELFRRGYRLGLVSNTTSSVEVPALLKELEITGCFETVILSAVIGKRKPNPAILLDATQRMNIAPERCVYIGDRVDRDVAAARRAGFSKAIILRDPRHRRTYEVDKLNLAPDHIISNLRELLDIFPPRAQPKVTAICDASLSTMWAIKTVPTLQDFVEFARRAGFAHVELNHKVTSAMLARIDLHGHVSSVHEPCPADIAADDLKKRDWLISSINEDCRCEGVKAIRRSIDLAAQLDASTVVIHAGHVGPDTGAEKKLRAWIASGQHESEEYRDIQRQMVQTRARAAGAAFDSVKKSIVELLAYAENTNVKLGIENRYHYMEIPSPDELESLLNLASPDRIGMIYDVGHAQTLDLLGFYPHEEWLRRFAPRILGTHLHDLRGTTDHYAPGLGDVDFDMIAAYLPANAFRTCEFQTFNTPEQVKAGLKVLVECGCIKLQN